MYLDLVYASYVLIFAHFIENVRSNNGKTKIPCQIRKKSLIWGFFTWNHDCLGFTAEKEAKTIKTQ